MRSRATRVGRSRCTRRRRTSAHRRPRAPRTAGTRRTRAAARAAAQPPSRTSRVALRIGAPGRAHRTARACVDARARNASTASGTASATTALSAIPQATAMMPSSSTRTRMSASPSTLPAAYPNAAVRVVVERGQALAARPAKRCATAAGTIHRSASARRPARPRTRLPSGDSRSARPRARRASDQRHGDDSERSRVSGSVGREPPLLRARASDGRTATRIACAASHDRR